MGKEERGKKRKEDVLKQIPNTVIVHILNTVLAIKTGLGVGTATCGKTPLVSITAAAVDEKENGNFMNMIATDSTVRATKRVAMLVLCYVERNGVRTRRDETRKPQPHDKAKGKGKHARGGEGAYLPNSHRRTGMHRYRSSGTSIERLRHSFRIHISSHLSHPWPATAKFPWPAPSPTSLIRHRTSLVGSALCSSANIKANPPHSSSSSSSSSSCSSSVLDSSSVDYCSTAETERERERERETMHVVP